VRNAWTRFAARAVTGLVLMTATAVQAEPVRPGAPERAKILEAARPPVTGALGRPVRFEVQRLERIGDWAFLRARMVGADGRPIDYAGTPLAEAAEQGVLSKTYVALLRREGGAWRTLAHLVGPTDVAWAGWSARYGAPAELLKP